MIEKYINILKTQFEVVCSNTENAKREIDNILYEPLIDKDNDPLQAFYKYQSDEEFISAINDYFSTISDLIEKIDNDNILMSSNVENWSLMIQSNIRTVEGDSNNKKLEDEYFERIAPNKDENFIERQTFFNIWISLFHTLLYTMNGYIVQTTNGQYISSLGSDAILSGIIMSFTHLSSVASTLVYSHWTNSKSYKFSLIVSCVCLVLGNFLYSIADGLGSLTLMGLGRFLVGCGGARIVNRRFLIDHIPKGLIGMYSLFYVNFNCLGMSTGNINFNYFIDLYI